MTKVNNFEKANLNIPANKILWTDYDTVVAI